MLIDLVLYIPQLIILQDKFEIRIFQRYPPYKRLFYLL